MTRFYYFSLPTILVLSLLSPLVLNPFEYGSAFLWLTPSIILLLLICQIGYVASKKFVQGYGSLRKVFLLMAFALIAITYAQWRWHEGLQLSCAQTQPLTSVVAQIVGVFDAGVNNDKNLLPPEAVQIQSVQFKGREFAYWASTQTPRIGEIWQLLIQQTALKPTEIITPGATINWFELLRKARTIRRQKCGYKSVVFAQRVDSTGSISTLRNELESNVYEASAHWRERSLTQDSVKSDEKPASVSWALPWTSGGVAMIVAILVGRSEGLTPHMWQVLQSSQTVHLAVVSGLHLGIIFGFIFYFIGRILRVLKYTHNHRLVQTGLAMTGVLFYAQLVEWPVSVKRAVIMLGLFVLITMSRTVRFPWGMSLIWCLIIILAWDPMQALSPGLWLSLGIVMSILWFSLPAGFGGQSVLPSSQIAQLVTEAPVPPTFQSPILKLLHNVWQKITALLRLQLSVTLGLLLLTSIFGLPLYLYSIFVNLVAVPIAAVVTMSTLVAGTFQSLGVSANWAFLVPLWVGDWLWNWIELSQLFFGNLGIGTSTLFQTFLGGNDFNAVPDLSQGTISRSLTLHLSKLGLALDTLSSWWALAVIAVIILWRKGYLKLAICAFVVIASLYLTQTTPQWRILLRADSDVLTMNFIPPNAVLHQKVTVRIPSDQKSQRDSHCTANTRSTEDWTWIAEATDESLCHYRLYANAEPKGVPELAANLQAQALVGELALTRHKNGDVRIKWTPPDSLKPAPTLSAFNSASGSENEIFLPMLWRPQARKLSYVTHLVGTDYPTPETETPASLPTQIDVATILRINSKVSCIFASPTVGNKHTTSCSSTPTLWWQKVVREQN